MLILNICFTSLISSSVDKDSQPLAVTGRFYGKLFGYVANVIEFIASKEEATEEPEMVIEHHFGTTFYVTEGSHKFTTTLKTCSCGEKDCRHVQAVNKHREGALRITLPVQVKCDGIRRLLAESANNRKYYV